MKFTVNILLTCILYFWDLTEQNNLMTTILASVCKQHPNFRSTFIALATLVSLAFRQRKKDCSILKAILGQGFCPLKAGNCLISYFF